MGIGGVTEFVAIALATVVALLPITNPVSTSALFVSITAGDSEQAKERQAYMGCVYTFWILITFLVAGSLILTLFGISLSGLRIAGGLMVARLGFGMLRPGRDDGTTPSERREAAEKQDISFVPLAMPSMSGPGAIAVTLGLAAEVDHWIDYAGIALGIAVVCVVCWLALRASERLLGFLGENGVNALVRIMGFLLLCVGVQFVVNGIIGVVVDEAFLDRVVESWQRVQG